MGNKITVNNIEYPSWLDAAKAHGIPYNTVTDRLHAGWTINQTFGYEPPKRGVGNSTSIIVGGIEYKSKKAAHRTHPNMSYPTVITRLNSGWEPDEAYGLIERKEENIIKKCKVSRTKEDYIIIVDGVEYENLTIACRELNKCYTKVERRLNRGWTIDEAFDLVGKRLGEIKLQGRVFDNLEDAVKAYRLNICFVYKELRKGKTLHEAFHLRNPDKLIINGERCKYIENVLDKSKIPNKKYKNKLRLGWYIEEIIEGERLFSRNKYYTVFGKTFKSITKLAEYYNQPRDNIYSRLIRGWTLEEAVIGKRKRKRRKK